MILPFRKNLALTLILAFFIWGFHPLIAGQEREKDSERPVSSYLTLPPSGTKTYKSAKISSAPFIILGTVAVGVAVAYFVLKNKELFGNKSSSPTLHVNSTPSPAKVYIDGEEKCETPCTVDDVSAGHHTVKVERELYGKWEEEMDLEANREYNIEAELAPYKYKFEFCFGKYGYHNGELYHPYDVAVDGAGNIYVADYYNGRIQKFSRSGSFIKKFVTFYNPTGLAYHPDSNTLYVLTVYYLYNFSLKLEKNWGMFFDLDEPRGMGIDDSGNLYLTEAAQDRIIKLDSKGKQLKSWTVVKGSWPVDAAPGQENNLYISACELDKIFIYSTTGSKKGEFSQTMDCPAFIDVDRMGHVYVTAHYENRIYKFLPDGTFVLKFGNQGRAEGKFYLPTGIAVDEEGNLVIAEYENNRICKWSLSSQTTSTAKAKISIKRKKGSIRGKIAPRPGPGLGFPWVHKKPRKIKK